MPKRGPSNSKRKPSRKMPSGLPAGVEVAGRTVVIDADLSGHLLLSIPVTQELWVLEESDVQSSHVTIGEDDVLTITVTWSVDANHSLTPSRKRA